MAGVLVTLALVEYIQAPISLGLVKLFSGEIPPEVGSVHSMKPAIGWVVPVRSRVVTAAAATAPPVDTSSAAATSSLGVEFGYLAITLALDPSSRPWRELDFHLGRNLGDGPQPISQ